MISLGILGEYVGRIYEQAKDRPIAIVRETVGGETLAVPLRKAA
jgi:dolichol-phosphate mannosyltransferase